MHGIREGFHQERLREAGHALQQGMATRRHGDEHLLNDILLAHDALRQFGAEFLVASTELFSGLGVGWGGHG